MHAIVKGNFQSSAVAERVWKAAYLHELRDEHRPPVLHAGALETEAKLGFRI